MLGLGWLTLKQAQEALRAGRLDDAQEILSQPQIQGHKRYWDLLCQLMRAYVERGEKSLRQDDSVSAWNDLLKAEQFAITDNAPIRLRQELTRLGLAEVRALLDAGEPSRAVEAIAQLRARAVRHPEIDALEEGAKAWKISEEQKERGEFALASRNLERVARLLPNHKRAVESFHQKTNERKNEFEPKLEALYEAAQNNKWRDVLRLSEGLLAQAPQHNEVRRLRARAWKAVEPVTIVQEPAKSSQANTRQAEDNQLKRFILWIDGVGGFLVCLDNRLTIGQAGPECLCDIPLYADISRVHATITRDSEGYVLEATRAVSVNNADVDKKLLQSGQRLTIGASCQLLFQQDAPISASARLNQVSGHRFGHAVDGVLLMAETLLLGPGSQVHVSLPISSPIILYRNKKELGIRSTEKICINGQPIKDRGVLEPGCTISGSDFAMALEPVGNL